MQSIASGLWRLIEKIAYVCLCILFKILRKPMTDEAFKSFMQFVRFGVVGLSNTIISYVLYSVSLIIFNRIELWPGKNYLIAQVIAFVLSVLWSFYWNNRLVFTLEEGKQRSLWKSLIKTYISYSFTGLFLNTILLILWIQVCGISEFIAPIINLVVSVPLNFIINKFWAFKQK